MTAQPTLPITIGWRERLALPSLGIERITAKIDTGARTSSLHAFSVEEYHDGGAPWVRFGVHPYRRRTDYEVWCEALVVDERAVKSSTGEETHRYFIVSTVLLGGAEWDMEISLADREGMGYRMLLGRSALQGQCLIDPSASYLQRLNRKRSRT